MSQKPTRLGFLVLTKHHAPELRFTLPEGIAQWFIWVDTTQTKWSYKKPGTHICEVVFAVGDDVYDSDSPLLGIYDLNNDDHLQKIVARSWNQQMVTEDLHLYP